MTKTKPDLDLADFNRWAGFINVFRQLHPRMELQMILVFLHIAAFPERTQAEIARQLGVTQAAVSRNVTALAKRGDLELDLVATFESVSDRRYKTTGLTTKGRALLAQLRAIQ